MPQISERRTATLLTMKGSRLLPSLLGMGRGQEAARQLVIKMGLETWTRSARMTDGSPISWYTADAFTSRRDFARCQGSSGTDDFFRINDLVRDKLGRKITVAPRTVLTHTRWADANNMKAHAGEHGLNGIRGFAPTTLSAGAQRNAGGKAIDTADAVLVSQVVTQKNVHIANMTRPDSGSGAAFATT